MIAGVNAMERLGSIITNKNSRICADFDIDAAKKSFQEKFYIENECNEIVYEYAVSYLQIIAEIISAVKITSKERNSLYWRIAEVAKKLGLFVICEIEQEELGYILENTTKIVAENRIIDAVIINIDLEDNNNDQKIFQFLGLLKKAKKAVFIKVKEGQEKPKRRWWELFSKKKEKTPRQHFSNLQSVEPIGHDEIGRPTYLMVGVAILKQEDYDFLSTYTFSLICNYEEEKIDKVVSLFDGDRQGALVVINFDYNTQEDWKEELLKEVTQKNERLNNAINEFYGIED